MAIIRPSPSPGWPFGSETDHSLTLASRADTLSAPLRRDGRAAEGVGLLNRYTGLYLYRGFESRSLRFMNMRLSTAPAPASPQTVRAGEAPTSAPTSRFPARHVGPSEHDVEQMLSLLGLASLEQLVERTIPAAILAQHPPALPAALEEHQMLEILRGIASQNKTMRSLIGMGYYGCFTAPVIARNVLENPGWYTSYTPYQAEIAQGRLEALLNFQTMVSDLTALPLANASLLDEATAAAEAMSMCRAISNGERRCFFIAENCHPQTIAVVRARAAGLDIDCAIGPVTAAEAAGKDFFGILLQYPATDGHIGSYDAFIQAAHGAGTPVVVASDLLALTLLRPPGEFGADIAVGSAQRLGLPLGFGGPHAAFLAAKNEFARKMPGRIVGVSRDAAGKPALRLAIQTREQHIRREKATSNICTAQALPAIIAAMHAVYHGPEGLRAIARRIHTWTALLAAGLGKLGYELRFDAFFDTLRFRPPADLSADKLLAEALHQGFNLRMYDNGDIGLSLDERTDLNEVHELLGAASLNRPLLFSPEAPASEVNLEYPPALRRSSPFLTHPVFNSHHCETEMQRYLHRLEARDLSLTTSMIPLGSCTMKLNAAAEMMPISWPQWADIHPFAPADQAAGYNLLLGQLATFIREITGLDAVSLQPNAGAQGEYAGLMVIRAYHRRRNQPQRDICLIPDSAHGTNPASATIAGLRVQPVACDSQGNIDLDDLRHQAGGHRDQLACLMVTYPSTHGVFEENIQEICRIVHDNGGQVYLDGANMNAMVGLCRPADIGADVCHLNLHKTFCIPHGGGGPGMGPIAAAAHLAPFLPRHPLRIDESSQAIGPVAAAPYGSGLILTIPWAYIRLMGADGLRRATAIAILNANYMAKRLENHYRILFRGTHGFCAHEFIVDAREFEESAGVKVEDIAKRLMDYGFHAPTVSWPEPGTFMIEPTESEPKDQLDRFCDALIAIRGEIREIEQGRADRKNNPLKNAPHTAVMLAADSWPYPYSRRQAAYPLAYLEEHKFWPPVRRIDNPYGDRHLLCTCPPG